LSCIAKHVEEGEKLKVPWPPLCSISVSIQNSGGWEDYGRS